MAVVVELAPARSVAQYGRTMIDCDWVVMDSIIRHLRAGAHLSGRPITIIHPWIGGAHNDVHKQSAVLEHYYYLLATLIDAKN